MASQMQQLRRLAGCPAWVAFTWFGMTAGIALIATPVRFASGVMSRPVALDVARVVFGALNQAELVALILLLVFIRLSGQAKFLWPSCSVLALILIAQTSWLLPELSGRTDQVMAGIEPATSIAHGAYSVLTIGKLLILFYVGLRSMQLYPPGGNR